MREVRKMLNSCALILAIELTPTYFASANTTVKTVFEPMFDLLADRLVVTVGRDEQFSR